MLEINWGYFGKFAYIFTHVEMFKNEKVIHVNDTSTFKLGGFNEGGKETNLERLKGESKLFFYMRVYRKWPKW